MAGRGTGIGTDDGAGRPKGLAELEGRRSEVEVLRAELDEGTAGRRRGRQAGSHTVRHTGDEAGRQSYRQAGNEATRQQGSKATWQQGRRPGRRPGRRATT